MNVSNPALNSKRLLTVPTAVEVLLLMTFEPEHDSDFNEYNVESSVNEAHTLCDPALLAMKMFCFV